MVAEFSREFVVSQSDGLCLQGLSDLALRQVDGRVFVYASSEYLGGLTSFEILPDHSIVTLLSLPGTELKGTSGLAHIDLVSRGTSAWLIPSAHYAAGVKPFVLAETGGFTQAPTSGGGSAYFSHFAATDSIVLKGGVTMIYASRWDQPGLQWFALESTGKLTRKGSLADSKGSFLGDVTDIETARFFGKKFLFTASGIEAGVQSHKINPTGTLTFADKSGPGEKWGFQGPTVIETAQIGSKAFLVMGASESNSLTVYSVSATGSLTPVDHVIDTRETRFGSIQALTRVEANGRVYLVAGGGDDGLTLLQLSPDGHLHVVASLADTFDTTLTNVSAIKAAAIFGELTILAGSKAEGGFTSFHLGLGNPGNVLAGGSTGDRLTGTALDDDIYGNDGNDRLTGGDGDDRLVDGTGTDRMSGGPGADIFEFADDGKTDTVHDFEPGIDRIDLSVFPLLYHHSEVRITPMSYGYDIRVGDDLCILQLAAGALEQPFQFGEADFLFI